QLVVLKNAAGIQRGTINSRKEDLLDYLDEYVGGFRCDSGEGAGPNVTDIGLGGGRGGGRGGENLGESNTSTGGGEMASASCD
ncbi:unnamed protein product, partial [Pylaiella littoralis]